jgi:predicted O-linked N-acetylglucosamine transferase (SPINDLY family)
MARLSPGQLLQKALDYHRAGNLGAAASRYQDVLKDNPKNYDAQRLLGVVAYQRKNYESAERILRKAISLHPGSADAHYFLGRCLSDMGRTTEAVQSLNACLVRDPRHQNAALSLAALCEATGDAEGALRALTQVLATGPRSPDLLLRRGKLLLFVGRPDEAVIDFNEALAGDAKLARAMFSRADAFMRLGRYADAIPDIAQAVALDPSLNDGGAFLLHCRVQIADWQDIAQDERELKSVLRDGSLTPHPMALMSLDMSAQEQRDAAERFMAAAVPPQLPLWSGTAYRHERLRIAYLSGDFRDHAVGYLMAGVFEHHNRARFETFAISTATRETPMAMRLRAAFEHFIDVSNRPDGEIAQLIRDREIDVVIDLGGLTMSARPGIAAYRPAPVYVNFLGYAGTMGLPSVDYLVGDAIVTPPSDDAFFVEKVVRLPDCYLPNDDQRAIAPATPSREEQGLPPEGFVFCSFNNIYKITPYMFDVWMRLLLAIDGSVLWLQQGHPTAADNLRREAAARGVDPARLVFAPRTDANADHLARQRLADLFLDTLPYNAHSTTADALWAGLPVLTCVGPTFPGRVAASLLHAAGLDDLVTSSLADYEAKALSLARNPADLAALKLRVAQARHSPLFDTARFTRHLEQAFVAMVERSEAGEAPASFNIAPIA